MSVTIDPQTGEVTVDTAALAAEYVAVTQALQQAELEAGRLRDLQAHARRELVRWVGVDGAAHADDETTVVVVPGAAGKRSVDRAVASEHREPLLAAGLGEVVTEFRAPTLAAVQAARAELVAAGVPMDLLIKAPAAGEPQIKIIRKGAASGC